ncbi:MAG: hypothetical protein ACOYM0_12730 [Bacteroidales bacterium]
MKKSLIILAFGFCLVVLFSCKKKDSSTSGSSLGSYSFTSSDLTVLPYPTYDTLIFKSTEQDSILYTFRGRSSAMKTFFEHPGNPVGYQGNYYSCEENSSGFISQNSDYLIFNLHYSDPFLGNAGKKYFNIGVMISSLESCSFFAQFRFEPDTLLSYLPNTSFTSGGYVKAFYYALTIGPRLYENVYELVGPSSTSYCPAFIDRVYYSINQGIVGFSLNTGKKWFLLPAKVPPPVNAVTPRPYLPVYPASYWIYKTGDVTTVSSASNSYVNFKGLTLTTLDGQPINQYEGFVSYGTYEAGWVPVLSETLGATWEMILGNPNTNPNTRVFRVMQKTVDSRIDSVIILKSFVYHKAPLYTNSLQVWQTFKKNVGLVFECMVDTAVNDTIYKKILIDYHINH